MNSEDTDTGRRILTSPPVDLSGRQGVLAPVMSVHGNVTGLSLTIRADNGDMAYCHCSFREIEQWLHTLTGPAASRLWHQYRALAALRDDGPAGCQIMGILNVTPDSFSDGGSDATPDHAVRRGLGMAKAGADIIDVGGESTRPGAMEVPVQIELQRVLPVVRALVAEGLTVSVDTRKAAVMSAAVAAGAQIINDVSALEFDHQSMTVAAETDADIVLMHAQGLPENMQDDPRYGDVVLDVYAALESRIDACEQHGINRSRLIVDPGIGFGKTVQQNLQLLHHGAMLHSTGCRVLMGASRKSVIGAVTGVSDPAKRLAGSLTIANWSHMLGLHMVRVHDVAETFQALEMMRACQRGTTD